MGDAGVGGPDGAAPGTEGDLGISPGTAGNLGIDASAGDLGVVGVPEGGVSGPDGKGGQGGGPVEIPPIEKPKQTPRPAKVEEKKAGIQRKARRRSILTGEGTEEKVYRRSILGR